MTNPAHATSKPALSVEEKVELPLPASQAWGLIQDFSRVEDWHPVVAKTRITSGTNNTPGAVRHLTFLNGGTLEEKITAYSAVDMRLEYTITAGEFPVRNYSTVLCVEAISPERSLVRWTGTFDRADESEHPVEGRDDKAAIGAARGVYSTGVNALAILAKEIRGIEETIGFYERGGTEGKPELVAKAFDPSATMKFARDGALVDVPIAQYFAEYIKPGEQQQRQLFIDAIHVRESAASARLTIDYATHQYIDFFNLLKIDGRWLIVSKIFHKITK
jgi:hypothetical protein